jgi:hypothetical protein
MRALPQFHSGHLHGLQQRWLAGWLGMQQQEGV